MIALTPDRHIVMVEQFRHGIGQITLELPGGIKETGEAPEDACERELLEESGYAGSRCRLIGQVSANPAMQNNHAHTGLITDAALRGPSRPDHLEEIRVRLVPLGEIPDLVRRGAIHHALIVAAFHHLSLAGL